MCGISGFLETPGTTSAEELALRARAMADTLAHRGPDDQGVWVDASAGVALGHRRLAILDLSPAGHQPMLSAAGRYVIVFNGEIYNHLTLRAALRHSPTHTDKWRGHSDTETLLAAIEAWGIEAALQRSVGMFAFALWDREARTLTLARDRMGEKPLYYGWQRRVFLFGSELKALRAHPAFLDEIDRDALALYLRYNYVPAPYSIYQGIRKLPPGGWLSLTERDTQARITPPVQCYWSLHHAVQSGRERPFAGNDDDAVQALEDLLHQTIQDQMLADVPVGAFLSGGVDSSTIVAVMQARSSQPVKTFTIGFHEQDYNEAEHARAIAAYLGCQHTELYLTPQQAMAVIPRLPTVYDEPFSDSSQIPTSLVAKLARRDVVVTLSGDGGDELFGGYNRYLWARSIWNYTKRLPLTMRKALAAFLVFPPVHTWNRVFEPFRALLRQPFSVADVGTRIHKLADLLRADSSWSLYRHLVSNWTRPAGELVIGANEPLTILERAQHWPTLESFEERMMYLDQATYLPDDILVKVDRAAMGASLESRVPFLDHRIVEFAWRLPLQMKIRDRYGKWVLRQLLYKYVPPTLCDRPKMGFGVPIDQWLCGPLRAWAEELLSERRLIREGFFSHAWIRNEWADYLAGRRRRTSILWAILMFQAWLSEYHEPTFKARNHCAIDRALLQ